MYANLRTNLPREVMSYTDFPFTRSWGDPRRFCGHAEVHNPPTTQGFYRVGFADLCQGLQRQQTMTFLAATSHVSSWARRISQLSSCDACLLLLAGVCCEEKAEQLLICCALCTLSTAVLRV